MNLAYHSLIFFGILNLIVFTPGGKVLIACKLYHTCLAEKFILISSLYKIFNL